MIRASALMLSLALATAGASAEAASVRVLTAPFPCLSQDHATATLTTAYAEQRSHNQLRASYDPVIGFKAGLTTVALQQRFGSSSPVFGVLFQQAERTAANGLRLSEFRNAKLETEIGFVAAEAITSPLQTTSELRRYFRDVVPAIEIPDVSFVDGCTANMIDLVAANVAATQHIRGEPKPWASLPDLNTVTVSLQRDQQVIARSTANAVQPSIETILLYLVNEALQQGHTIAPGQLFITGALSGLVDAKPGQHIADFGALGTIRFTVQP